MYNVVFDSLIHYIQKKLILFTRNFITSTPKPVEPILFQRYYSKRFEILLDNATGFSVFQ